MKILYVVAAKVKDPADGVYVDTEILATVSRERALQMRDRLLASTDVSDLSIKESDIESALRLYEPGWAKNLNTLKEAMLDSFRKHRQHGLSDAEIDAHVDDTINMMERQQKLLCDFRDGVIAEVEYDLYSGEEIVRREKI